MQQKTTTLVVILLLLQTQKWPMPIVAKLPKETLVDPCLFTHHPVWARKPPKLPGKPLVLCLQLHLLPDHLDPHLVILIVIIKLIIGIFRPETEMFRQQLQLRNPPPHHKMTMPIILAQNVAMKVFVPMILAHVVIAQPVMAAAVVVTVTTIRVFRHQKLTKQKN